VDSAACPQQPDPVLAGERRDPRYRPKNTPFFLIANFSAGGTWAPLKGGPNANTPFPASMDIDWLRRRAIQVMVNQQCIEDRPTTL
jgi:hypothetical protein